MLAKRVIPTLLADGEKLVKGERFNPWRTVGVVEQAARICGLRAVDEIILLDVTATKQGRAPNYELVSRISQAVFTPLTVGGGVASAEHVRRLLENGADKVAIGSHWEIIRNCAERFGSQAIVAALDYRRGENGEGMGLVRSSYRQPGGPISWARELQDFGAGEILLTCMDREGTMQGYDLGYIQAVSQVLDIPVIAHGGCGSYQHMLEALQAGADAVAAGALFQFTDATPLGAAQYLAAHSIETRIPG